MSSLIHRVAAAMKLLAPLCLADRSWDNVGILVENPSPRGSGVVVLTIDLTRDVLEECLALNAEVVIAYHPTIFSGMKSLTLPKQEVVLRAIAAGISIYSPHTALDAVEGGINDWLASLLTAKPRRLVPIEPLDLTEQERRLPRVSDACGVGRLLQLDPIPFVELVARVKAGLGLERVRVALPLSWADKGNHPVQTVAICAGSGAGVFRKLPSGSHVDVLFTGEMGHHDVLAARAAGQAVILCEHTNTERGFLKARLAPLMQTALGKDVKVCVSTTDADPLTIW